MSSVRAGAALAIVGVVVGLLLAEGVLRLIGYSNPLFYAIDEDLGLVLRPGAEGWWSQEGRAYVKINSDGLRDVEHSVQKPRGTVRVAILGDSYAEGLQLPIDKLFWKVLEKRLTGCLENDAKAEVINFGVSGYGTGRELLMLRKKARKYQPDLVILAFLTGNDISDNSKALNHIDYIPYFELSAGELVLDRSYLRAEGFRARSGWLAEFTNRYINHVRLLQLANAVRQHWRAGEQIERRSNIRDARGEIGLDNAIYQQPTTPEWRDAWELTEALILALDKEVTAMGARLLVVTLSNGIQVNPDRELRRRFMNDLGVADLFYPDQRVNSLAKQHGIDALMLGPVLRAWAESSATCLHGFGNVDRCEGHWNEQAHRLAGELIAEKVCADVVR